MKASQPTSFGELEGLDYLKRKPDMRSEMSCERLRVHPSAFILCGVRAGAATRHSEPDYGGP